MFILFLSSCLIAPFFICHPMLATTVEAQGRNDQHITTTFGLELYFASGARDDISIERIDPVIEWDSIEDNNTLNVYFNITSATIQTVNLTMIYRFDYRFGNREAAFYPDTFTFSEAVDGGLEEVSGALVDLEKETITQFLPALNVSYNRTFTVTGELDLDPPAMVTIDSIKVMEEGEITVEFQQVSGALGYHLYLTEKKCVNVEDAVPYTSESFIQSPVVISGIEPEEVVYISIAAFDFTGNINPQVDCQRFEMRLPNRPPVAKIDPIDQTYYPDELVYFTCRNTHDPDPKDDLEYRWDLDGDGEDDSTEETPTFRYEEPGTYLITLIVTDKDGISDTDTMEIVILERGGGGEENPGNENIIFTLITGMALFSLAFIIIIIIIIIVLIVRRKKRVEGKTSDTSGKKGGKVTFRKKEERANENPVVEGGDVLEGSSQEGSGDDDRTFTGIDVMDDFGGNIGIESEEEIMFLPMRATLKPERKKGRKRRRKRKRSARTPLVAAVSLEENEGEKETDYFACPGCDEVLEVLITRKNASIEKKYPVSCPVCGVSGEIEV